MTTECVIAPVPSPLDDARRAELATLLKAVADPVRLGLLGAIAAGEDTTCVCALPDLGVSQPTVSHHLRRLRDAGLVADERRGTWVHYRLTTQGLRVWRLLADL